MKLKPCLLTFAGLVAFSLAAFAQDNPPSGAAAAAATPTTSEAAQPGDSTTPASVAAAADTASAPATPAPASPPAEAAPATPEAAPASREAAPASREAASPPADAAPATPPDPGTVIPLILMEDVPLTDAIKNLARQAGLNYMLDPKVSFGQTGPDGKAVPQPMVSIRWENVTAQQALGALLANYNLQIIEDPKSKIYRVTIKDPDAPDPISTMVVQLAYANPTNIMAAIQNTLSDKRSRVVSDIRTSQLVVVATDKELADVEKLVQRLDTPTKQVLIEAKLFETSLSPSSSKGIDWSGTFGNQKVAFGNNLAQQSPSDSLNNTLAKPPFPKLLLDTAKGFNPSTAFLDADGLSAVISFLNKSAEAKVISAPRTVTLDNETAKIEVTRASPIINVTPGTVQVAGGSQITYTNLGIILNVTPRISANNLVNLKVIPEVSRIFDTVQKIVENGVYQADEYDIRRMETRVMIPSGNTLVLGGLVQDDVRKGNTKVPLLGDIPYLGPLFRTDTKSRQKSNLTVFLTPTIVEDSDFQPTKSDYLKSPVPMSDSVEEDWSYWNSGKPRDWSKKPAAEKQATAPKAVETPAPSQAQAQSKFSDLPVTAPKDSTETAAAL